MNQTVSSSFQKHRFVFDFPIFDQGNNPAFHIPPVPEGTSRQLYPEDISINQAVFLIPEANRSHLVTIIQQCGGMPLAETQTVLFCDCDSDPEKLCPHEIEVLNALMGEELQLFFNSSLRNDRMRRIAADYGLEKEKDLDQHFRLELVRGKVRISPRNAGLTPITRESLGELQEQILPNSLSKPPESVTTGGDNIIVLKQHKYYKYLVVELHQAQQTKDGKLKNPVRQVNAQERFWNATDPEELKFLMGLVRIQRRSEEALSIQELTALRAIIRNPLRYTIYYHLPDVSEKVTATSLRLVQVKLLDGEVMLDVSKADEVYELNGKVSQGKKNHDLKDLPVRYGCFLEIDDTFFLVDDLASIGLINLFRKKEGSIIIYKSRFQEFKAHFLDRIDNKVPVAYNYLPEATDEQLQAIDNQTEKLIYLSDFGQHVMVIPVVRYGESEISVRTKQQVYVTNDKGESFFVRRNDELETAMLSLVSRQHPEFRDQLENGLDHFYLHKRDFLDETWFLNVFDEWENNGITVLGFNEIPGNKFNPQKGKLDIKVLSGINWFNAKIDVKFGKKKASLKNLHIAVKNRNKYIQLSDGTIGILPQEWIDKFSDYFNAGEILDDDTLGIPKVNFESIEQLFDARMLDEPVRQELELYRQKINDFSTIKEVEVPKTLNGTLRPYQREGLSWLNFLDDFNFGGCLADDMGLGKSIQLIAFLLLQQKKVGKNTNLLVVPTTLMFNWRAELAKFAPMLKVHSQHGPDRQKTTSGFDEHQVILISYNNLLTDISFLKDYMFNYVIMDESQQIKNPESQRYKAARLLRSRSKLVVTGTPVENNTFDLYSQFSFACPGLLGSKQFFKELYSVPIDRFKDDRRAQELQRKIKPFLLRRTKEQVASELPQKTEMVLYCEMKEEQRKIYDAHEKEFRDFLEATPVDNIDKQTMYVLRGLTKLRQICNSPQLIDDREVEGMGLAAKLEVLMEQIEDNTPHHKMLVFSQFVTMLELIKAELEKRDIGYTILTGSTRDREGVVNAFQSKDEKRVFLISLKAGGTGLNLVEASYVYLVDPWWNPAVENQAIDRVHRIGQQKNVTAIRMICPDTVEEKIMQLQAAKKALAGGLVTSDNGFFKSLSRKELMGLLG